MGTAEHTALVAASADLLLHRMIAIRAIGMLDEELQSLGTEENWLTN